MGLQFYVGEVQAQVNDAVRVSNEAKQAIAQLQHSISQFLSAPLSGKAYSSAKNYFSVAYTPLCRSAIMTGEALVQAHKRLLSEYQSSVSSIDTIEDQILGQIQQFEQVKQALDRQMREAKTMRPDLERRYMNACDCIKQRREKLQKFHDYNSRSASFFNEYEACQQEFNRGIAQVQNSKAWNSASGTFNLGLLDMSWAVSVNERWEQRAQVPEQERLDKFNKGMEGRSYCRVDVASGASVFMWVKNPLKVTQEDLQFNEEYKEYLNMLLHPKENNIVDEYFSTMAEELRTGKNAKTGEPLNDVEKAQRWSVVLSAISVAVIGAYYGSKNYSDSHVKAPKDSVIKGEKNGKNYTLDKNKSKGNYSYKKNPKLDFSKNNFANISDMNKAEILNSLPKDWSYTENNGFIHVRDSNGQVRMKIDPSDKVTKYDHVHLFDSDGNIINKNGEIVDRKSTDAHIPYKK